MNKELINELVKVSTDDICGVNVLDKTRYAENIVRECAALVANSENTVEALNNIKERFGL